MHVPHPGDQRPHPLKHHHKLVRYLIAKGKGLSLDRKRYTRLQWAAWIKYYHRTNRNVSAGRAERRAECQRARTLSGLRRPLLRMRSRPGSCARKDTGWRGHRGHTACFFPVEDRRPTARGSAHPVGSGGAGPDRRREDPDTGTSHPLLPPA